MDPPPGPLPARAAGSDRPPEDGVLRTDRSMAARTAARLGRAAVVAGRVDGERPGSRADRRGLGRSAGGPAPAWRGALGRTHVPGLERAMGGVSPALPDVRGLSIAHLIESDGPGGAEQVVVDLATHLQAAGARNVVVLPANGEGWLARQLSGSGVGIEYFRLNTPVSPACARSLAAVFHRHEIAVAHSHEFALAVYGSWASWLA